MSDEIAANEEDVAAPEEEAANANLQIIVVHQPGGGSLPTDSPVVNNQSDLNTGAGSQIKDFEDGTWLYWANEGAENAAGADLTVNYSDPQQPGVALDVSFLGTVLEGANNLLTIKSPTGATIAQFSHLSEWEVVGE
jgi:hypothetical protein